MLCHPRRACHKTKIWGNLLHFHHPHHLLPRKTHYQLRTPFIRVIHHPMEIMVEGEEAASHGAVGEGRGLVGEDSRIEAKGTPD